MLLLFSLLHFAFAQSPALEGVQTGRYEVHRAAPPATAAKSPVLKKKRKPNSEIKVQVSESVSTDESAAVHAQAVVADKVEKADVEKSEEIVEPSLGEQAQKLMGGQVDQVYNFYQERVHPDDPRNNRVEIDFSPGYIHNESKSNYSFRDYGGSFSSLTLGSRVWFTPRIGIEGKFTFSLAADLGGDKVTQSRVPARYEFLDLSLNLRNYFGLSRKAKSWELNVLYVDDKLSVPSDNTTRVKVKSSGVGLGVKARFPTSASYAWTVGGSFLPRMQHTEEATGVAAQSGSSSENTRIGFEFGGEFKFTRESQLIWSAGIRSEKNLFSGSASVADPATGQTPTNVGVTDTYYLFNLGYRWGQ